MPISSMWMVIVFGACSRASAMFNVLTVIATFSFLGLGAFAAGGALVAIPTPRSLATERKISGCSGSTGLEAMQPITCLEPTKRDALAAGN